MNCIRKGRSALLVSTNSCFFNQSIGYVNDTLLKKAISSVVRYSFPMLYIVVAALKVSACYRS